LAWRCPFTVKTCCHNETWLYILYHCTDIFLCIDGIQYIIHLLPHNRMTSVKLTCWRLAMWKYISIQCCLTSQTALLCLKFARPCLLVLLVRATYICIYIYEDEYRALEKCYWQGKTKICRQKPVPNPLCPPKLSYKIISDKTQASTVRDQYITAGAMAQPLKTLI